MNRCGYFKLMSVAALGLGFMATSVFAGNTKVVDDANESIAVAEVAVAEARAAIEKGKKTIAQIPKDSPLLSDVSDVVKVIFENWKVAVSALDGAKSSASKFSSVSSDAVLADYALLARVSAKVADSGASVVQAGLAYVDAIAGNKTESLDAMCSAMEGAAVAAADVRFNYDLIKSLIAEKYSN